MPAEMPAVRVAHHRAVLLEHPSQLELKFGGSGAVARPRRALFSDVTELWKVTELGFPLVGAILNFAGLGIDRKAAFPCPGGLGRSAGRWFRSIRVAGSLDKFS